MERDLPVELLEPAVEAARRALRDLEPEEVPASLRRVARYQDRGLPRPFRATLIEALASDGWLRERAMEAWPTMPPVLGPEADPSHEEPPGTDAGGRGRRDTAELVSALFLARPDGWEERITMLAGEGADRSVEQRIAGLQGTIDRLTAARDAAQAKLRHARREIERLRAAVEAAPVEAERRLSRRLRQAEHDAEQARRDLAEARAEVEALRAALAASEERNRRLRELLQRERRREEERAAASTAATVWPPSGGVELARRLDELFARFSARPAPSADEAGRAGDAGDRDDVRVALPAGVAPDRREAVEALIDRATPWRLVVDGYNVAGLLATAGDGSDAFHAPAMRARVLDLVAEVRRRSRALVGATVVWDSALVPDGAEAVDAGRQGIEVRYAPSADDEVARLAAQGSVPTVVVSSDREVQAAAEAAGATVLWSDALVDMARRADGRW